MSWADAPGDPAAAYARRLLATHGVNAEVVEPTTRRTSIEDWAGCGAMALTGQSDGPPQLVAGAPATAVRGALLALSAIATAAGLDADRLPDERLLGARAAAMGLTRHGSQSAGGASRLLSSIDGTVAVTLSRPEDISSIPALIERDAVADDPWDTLTDWCRERSSDEIVERATLLGLAVGAVDDSLPATVGSQQGSARPPRTPSECPVVVDLSALWAGPLCAHLLGLLGARVINVESAQRPDQTRDVAPAFHDALRHDAEYLSLELGSAVDLARLRDLLLQADIVIEASRPRALAQLGIDAAAEVAESGQCTWLSITAYGRVHNRIGYGDDVAAAAGLLGEGRVFAGDAIADPLAGTHAAVAALAAHSTGRPGVIDLAMYDVARAVRTPIPDADVVRRGDEWLVDDGSRLIPVSEPTVLARSR